MLEPGLSHNAMQRDEWTVRVARVLSWVFLVVAWLLREPAGVNELHTEILLIALWLLVIGALSLVFSVAFRDVSLARNAAVCLLVSGTTAAGLAAGGSPFLINATNVVVVANVLPSVAPDFFR